jgi:hypothetical protein
MPAMSVEAFSLDLLAAFAGALTAPPLAGLVLLAALVIRRSGLARATALALALVHGGIEWVLELRPSALLPHLLGSVAAGWLMVELVLQILLPLLRLARRVTAALTSLLARLV